MLSIFAVTLLFVASSLAQPDSNSPPGTCLCATAEVTVLGQRREPRSSAYISPRNLNDFHQPDYVHKIRTAYTGECFMYIGNTVQRPKDPQDIASGEGPWYFQVGLIDDDGIIGWIDGAKLTVGSASKACAVAPKIVPRTGPFGWGAHKPRRDIPRLRHPIKCVVIHRTATRQCKNKQDCLTVVKEIQRYHLKEMGLADIKNNFLVGEDGRVYQGRGFNRTGAHTDGYNQCSLGISVIDSFQDKIPRPPALDAVQQLIAYGVAKGFIAQDYKLSVFRDLAPGSSGPGARFIKLIRGELKPGDTKLNPDDPLIIPAYDAEWYHYAKCDACEKRL